MAFVSNPTKDELLIGLVAALIGAIADWDVKREKYFKFEPKASWLMLGLLLPWYVVKGSLGTLKAFFLRLSGGKLASTFKVSHYDALASDPRSAAKRALATAYLTIPPNSIIVGIDKERGRVLTHQMVPALPTLIERKLGVQS